MQLYDTVVLGLYALFVAGLVFFAIIPAVVDGSWSQAVLRGAQFGLVAYSTYDLTNLATIDHWPPFGHRRRFGLGNRAVRIRLSDYLLDLVALRVDKGHLNSGWIVVKLLVGPKMFIERKAVQLNHG